MAFDTLYAGVGPAQVLVQNVSAPASSHVCDSIINLYGRSKISEILAKCQLLIGQEQVVDELLHE